MAAGFNMRLTSRSRLWLWALLPVILALLWGPYLSDQDYFLIAAARNLAAGRQAAFGLDGTAFSPWRFPLPLLLLTGMARLSLPLESALWLLGAVGWGFATCTAYYAVRALGRAPAAPAVAALLALTPLGGTAFGSSAGWVVALFWWTLVLLLEKRQHAQLLVLALWFGCYFDWPTWLGITAFLIAAWRREKHLSWEAAFLWGLASGGLLGGWILFDLTPLPLTWGASAIIETGRRWLAEDFYWLLIPLGGLGIKSGRAPVMLALLGWGGTALVSGAPPLVAGLYAGGAVAAGLGCAWLAERGARAWHVPGKSYSMAGGAFLLALPFLLARGSALYTAYQARPVALNALEVSAGEWVRAHSTPGDVVWGEVRAGVAAQRPVIPWTGEMPNSETLARLLATLNLDPPAFCVSTRSLAWDRMTGIGWFEERYEPVQRFGSLADAGAPVTVWRYRESSYDRGEVMPVDLPLGAGARVVAYRRWPPTLKAGEPVYLTLLLRAETPIAEASRAIVRIFSPLTGENFAQVEHLIPQGLPVEWWLPGEIIAERFSLTTTATTPVGAYHLDLSVPDADVEGFKLAYVAVPWEGTIPPEATPVDASFENGVRLTAAQLPETLEPGEEARVIFYWEADAAPMEDVTVFVHLLNQDGQQVSGHDGMPMEGRYPTGAWQPGDKIPDVHSFITPEGLPAGSYRLAVGLYHPATVERLAVTTVEGETPSDRAVVLGSFTLKE